MMSSRILAALLVSMRDEMGPAPVLCEDAYEVHAFVPPNRRTFKRNARQQAKRNRKHRR